MLTIPAHAFPHRTPLELFAVARRGLAEAAAAKTAEERYATAHLAALRAAAAILAARARPAPGGRGRPTSVWGLLSQVAPELTDWASLFAAGARRRAVAEAGVPGVVTAEEAATLLLDAERFIAVVADALSITYRSAGILGQAA
ncbi:SAV_6107 family HEPN domain-containing protein [Longispora albida]|uniref:SAV_6107 family HEPN domain-containing protein n=1 Tax=Longispora albida TaxID=203523 RepID=UPI000376A5DF|nr:SAV_6107 family HEPN domain-containing protein [Longispora albida]